MKNEAVLPRAACCRIECKNGSAKQPKPTNWLKVAHRDIMQESAVPLHRIKAVTYSG